MATVLQTTVIGNPISDNASGLGGAAPNILIYTVPSGVIALVSVSFTGTAAGTPITFSILVQGVPVQMKTIAVGVTDLVAVFSLNLSQGETVVLHNSSDISGSFVNWSWVISGYEYQNSNYP